MQATIRITVHIELDSGAGRKIGKDDILEVKKSTKIHAAETCFRWTHNGRQVGVQHIIGSPYCGIEIDGSDRGGEKIGYVFLSEGI
jgi:hypothetical protein